MKLGGEKIPDGYRFHIEDNLNTLNCILEATGTSLLHTILEESFRILSTADLLVT